MQPTNTSSMSGGSTTGLFYRDLGARRLTTRSKEGTVGRFSGEKARVFVTPVAVQSKHQAPASRDSTTSMPPRSPSGRYIPAGSPLLEEPSRRPRHATTSTTTRSSLDRTTQARAARLRRGGRVAAQRARRAPAAVVLLRSRAVSLSTLSVRPENVLCRAPVRYRPYTMCAR